MNLFNRLFKRPATDPIHVTDPAVLDRFLRDPNFPWLISFPRTGSHWLRMIMELYFEKPSLRRIFYFHDATDFTCYHWHDPDLATQDVASVIYLYRQPVDTVYSQLRYHKEDAADAERVRHWAEVYAQHLRKWLFDETFTTCKTLVRYEGLRAAPHEEFAKVCAHFGATLDPQRLDQALAQVSKGELKKRTGHDEQIVNLSPDYDLERQQFRDRFGSMIEDIVHRTDPRLAELWKDGAAPR